MMLFDYHCEQHGIFEAWGNSGEPARCPRCNAACRSAPRFGGFSLEGVSGHFPTATDKWIRRHERQEEPGREI